jgi:hypothetical protein
MRICLAPGEVLQRIREALDNTRAHNRSWLWEGRLYVGRVKANSFWLQATPIGYLHPFLTATVFQDGFTTLLRVEVRRRRDSDIVFMQLGQVVLLLLWCAALGAPVRFSLVFTLLVIGLVGAFVSVALFSSVRSNDSELTFVKDVFRDEILAVDRAA